MGPLQGFTVIELAGLGPCPMAGMLLADMGAEVIRVERRAQLSPNQGGRGRFGPPPVAGYASSATCITRLPLWNQMFMLAMRCPEPM
jgi:crotonobetainyl-CoA:carnitine CoA-transferase CaiB-like acyl-CoA transferase